MLQMHAHTHMTSLNVCRLLLATGGTDTRVHLHVRPPGGQFQATIKLTGHENWVRSLAFKHVWAPASAGADQGEYRVCV